MQATATQKQIDYIKMLLKKKHGSEWITSAIRGEYGLSQREGRFAFTKAEASALIEKLLA